jgi:type VI secretion system protein ImpA
MYPITAGKPLDIDIEALLAPIPGDAPAGENLRYEGTYDKIREARIEDDPVLSQGVWKVTLKRANWADVAGYCTEALSKRSKDLQIATWLTEAWLHLHQFDGLRKGLTVVAALIRQYGEYLHPRPEEGDTDALEYWVSPIVWLNEKLPDTIRLLALTSPDSDDVRPYCWADWETATRAKPAGTTNTQVTQSEFQRSAMLTRTEFFQTLQVWLEACMDATAELEAALEVFAAEQAPSLRRLSSTLDDIRRLIVSILSQRDNIPAILGTAPADTRAETEAAANEAVLPAGPITTRAEAYRRLSEAAEFLARTEPHSPTPYLIRRAIAWGSMRLEDLLPDLFKNNAGVEEVFRLLQISKQGQK